MLRRRAIVMTLVLLVLGLSRGIAEASRYDFEGGNDFEVIIWDGDFDVSTMQNNCRLVDPSPCGTSVFLQGLVPVFAMHGGIGGTITFDSLDLVLIMPSGERPLSCPGFTCGLLSSFPRLLSLSEFNVDLTPGAPAGQTDRGFLILPALLPNGPGGQVQDGNTFRLTTGAATFLSTLSPVDEWRMGMRLHFCDRTDPAQFCDEPHNHVAFRLDLGLEQPGVNAVPEPATLALLGTGIATLVARRRRVRR